MRSSLSQRYCYIIQRNCSATELEISSFNNYRVDIIIAALLLHKKLHISSKLSSVVPAIGVCLQFHRLHFSNQYVN